MATPFQSSYDYVNQIRDVDPIFQQLIAENPTLFGLIPTRRAATNNKHEFPNDVLSPQKATITAMAGTGSETGFSIASTAGWKVGMVVDFQASTLATKAGLAKIATINANGTDFTITRNYGSTTLAVLAVGDIMNFNSFPQGEMSSPVLSAGTEPTLSYNYTQIFRKTKAVSATAMKIGMYGMNDPMAYQMRGGMIEILREINKAVLKGAAVARSSSEEGTMGGYLNYYLPSGLAVAVGGAITATKINDGFELINAAGGESSNFLIVCAPNQSRKISAFNTAVTNQTVMVPTGTDTTGQRIYNFTSDIALKNGFNAQIVVDNTMPRDQIILTDIDACEINYLRPMFEEDTRNPGFDGVQRTITTELTMTIKNAKQKHVLFTGCTQ